MSFQYLREITVVLTGNTYKEIMTITDVAEVTVRSIRSRINKKKKD